MVELWANRNKRGNPRFSTISLPTSLVREVEFGFRPRKTDFVREAVVQKLERYKHELEERRLYEEARALGVSLVSANQKNKR